MESKIENTTANPPSQDARSEVENYIRQLWISLQKLELERGNSYQTIKNQIINWRHELQSTLYLEDSVKIMEKIIEIQASICLASAPIWRLSLLIRDMFSTLWGYLLGQQPRVDPYKLCLEIVNSRGKMWTVLEFLREIHFHLGITLVDLPTTDLQSGIKHGLQLFDMMIWIVHSDNAPTKPSADTVSEVVRYIKDHIDCRVALPDVLVTVKNQLCGIDFAWSA